MSAYFDWWDGSERRVLLLDGERLLVGSTAESDLMVGDTFTDPATVREIAAALTVSENAVKLHAGAGTLGDLREQ